MDLKTFIDSTYLKTAAQAQLSDFENDKIVAATAQEAVSEKYKLVMVRPECVAMVKKIIVDACSTVDVGTVISFPLGTNSIAEKLAEATNAIADGADDLDFVINYEAFKNGAINLVKQEVLACTRLGIDHAKVVKWIIETAALTTDEIIKICVLIKNVVLSNFKEQSYQCIFIKSSTGFFKTENNLPNGATIDAIVLMLENGSPLSIKASGGIKTHDEAVAMIKLGVKRIGTSAAKAIVDNHFTDGAY